uniref:Potassium channel domain-containing protein n=2 Tax=Hemiselmis andersenii TaxID=464988 RepID=A0A7S0UGQ7_HEMAN|mmetsp:Transcript_617/g.1454  ORF Transcript_617/g.1454 Transcript_617/m.1454 type:complete len:1094 (+) Transcript_617:345-3626(+)
MELPGTVEGDGEGGREGSEAPAQVKRLRSDILDDSMSMEGDEPQAGAQEAQLTEVDELLSSLSRDGVPGEKDPKPTINLASPELDSDLLASPMAGSPISAVRAAETSERGDSLYASGASAEGKPAQAPQEKPEQETGTPTQSKLRSGQRTLDPTPGEGDDGVANGSIWRLGGGGHESSFAHSHSNWKENRRVVDFQMYRMRLVVAALGVTGIFVSVVENELIVLGREPASAEVNGLKVVGSVLTLGILVCLYYLYMLRCLMKRLLVHLRKLGSGHYVDTNVSPRHVFSQWKFWFEGLICLCHSPPFCTFEIPLWNSNNLVVYRAETMWSVLCCTRLYLMWPVVRDIIIRDLPKRQMIEYISCVHIDSVFALKILLQGRLAFAICVIGGIVINCQAAYVFRCCELTACKFGNPTTAVSQECHLHEAKYWSIGGRTETEQVNDLYFGDALWTMLITALTVGFGESGTVAYTHVGRLVSCICATLGIVLSATMTSSLTQSIPWSVQEHGALLLLEREKAKQQLQILAVNRLIGFWRKCNGKKPSLLQLYRRWASTGLDDERAAEMFRLTARTLEVDVEDMYGVNGQIDIILSRTKYVEQIIEELTEKLGQKRARGFMTMKKGPIPQVDLEDQSQSNNARNNLQALGLDADVMEEVRSATGLRRSNSVMKKVDWRRSRAAVHQRLTRFRLLSCVSGVSGLLFSVATNAMVMAGWEADEMDVVVCKAFDTLCTALSLFFVFKVHKYLVLGSRIDNHVKKGQALEVDVTPFQVLSSGFGLYVEWFILAIHLPPYVSFSVAVGDINIILYKAEALFSGFELLRCYLTWPVLREWLLSDLPKRDVISRLTGVSFGSLFALKRALNDWKSVIFIGCAWAFMTLICGYLLRTSELSACFVHTSSGHPACAKREAQVWLVNGREITPVSDPWILNSFWAIFVTSTTVGYGDVTPNTLMGRVAVGISGLVGILTAGLLTASIGSAVKWSGAEQSVLALLERERCNRDLKRRAVEFIIVWWRLKKKKRGKGQAMSITDMPSRVRSKFSDVRIKAGVNFEEVGGIDRKISNICQRSKNIKYNVESVNDAFSLHTNQGGKGQFKLKDF